MRQNRKIWNWIGLAVLAAVMSWPMPSRAQDESSDLPSRVGRISDVTGELFLAMQDRANEWAPIGLNYPVTAGDNLWVSANGRAEVDYGNGRMRLSGDTNLQIATLDDAELALFVASGKVIVSLRALAPGEVARIDTPNAQIDISRPGQYRVDVDEANARTTLTVREGEAGIRFAGGVQQTLPGQAATVMGLDGAGLAIQNGFGSDAFDSWSAARDQRYDASRYTAYVPADMVGARDLDDYGTWETTPTYGAVWYPSTVAVGWAPYRYGSWTWLQPWGWTWVDAAPWGYAPFHYGRWVWASGRWGWCPGDRRDRPRWAPALVGWYGGSEWAGGGTIYGWVPLGWGEPYVPTWRRCSGNCWRQYNQPYAVVQNDRRPANLVRYANAGVPGAMTAVNAAVLSGSRPVAPNQVNVAGLVARAPVLAGAPELAPPARSATRPVAAGPIPAGTQYQKLSRSVHRPGAAGPAPLAAEFVAAPGAMTPPRAAPSALTPGSGGTVVVAPPARPLAPTPVVAAEGTSAPAASSPVHGGMPGGRGAYTGVAPTPGPKAAAVVDRGIAFPVNAAVSPARPAPAAVVPHAGSTPSTAAQANPREAPVARSAPVAAPALAPGATATAVAPAPLGGVMPK